ncbi:MAG: glycosyltransferase family 2 protein [Candidatus Omnitrophica bacterium]|nr:glycosyltransferase family 2 protein [Candidatus Omnitrophota bacterium]
MNNRLPGAMLDLTLIIPVYNEQENLRELLDELTAVLKNNRWSYEILCIDDASTDRSFELLKQQEKTTSGLRVLRLRRRGGQTAAMAAGFYHAQGQAIVTLDADLQNDPQDIPALLKQLELGYDVVSGWRKDRRDSWMKKLPSLAANRLLARWTGIALHDSGCTLKAYRREALKNLTPYGDMHRIFPVYLAALGCRIGEVEVRHRPRKQGLSKYGLERTLRVFFDILAAAFVLRCSRTPLRTFGAAGFFLIGLGAAVGLWVAARVFWFGGIWVSPLLFVATALGLAGILFIGLGLLAEMLLWTGATTAQSRTYAMDVSEEEIIEKQCK